MRQFCALKPDGHIPHNPMGQGQGNVPLLLRRAADAIEEFVAAEIQDLVLHTPPPASSAAAAAEP